MIRFDCPHRVVTAGFAALVAATLAACSIDKQEMPPLAGPSEFALSLSMSAAPDTIPRDGESQSVITITARDAQSRPIVGQRITVTLAANAPQGTALSQSEVVTASNGQATVALTAPVNGSIGNIQVSATPIGTNASNATAHTIAIVATPENGTIPTPAFAFSPSSPDVGQTVTFDASTTRDEGVSCGACTFAWSFGGDGTATGMRATHAFTSGGAFVVTLTATDGGGSSATTQQTVTVSNPSIPTSLSVSPTTATASLAQTFTASATAATNHRIVSYQFIWGDGNSNTQTSPVIQHAYSQSGSYLLTLTVRDDLGQSATTNQVITVSSGLTASFSTSIAGTTVTFTATGTSSVASTITDYAWDFNNDGSYDTNGSSATTSNDFGASGTYTVKLRITDSRGVTQTSSATVTIP